MSQIATTPSTPCSAITDDQVDAGSAERLRQLLAWVDSTGAIGKDGTWYSELEAIVAGKGAHE